MDSLVNVSLVAPQASAIIGLILPALFLNVIWTATVGSRASLYLTDSPQHATLRASRLLRWTHTFLLFLGFAVACSCESVFLIKIWDEAVAAVSSSARQYFVPCLFLETLIIILLQLSAMQRASQLAGGRLHYISFMQTTLHQVPLLASGIIFVAAICSTSNTARIPLLYTTLGVWFWHVTMVCTSLVISLKGLRHLPALSEDERTGHWLCTGITVLNSIGYSLMTLNACWYIYSPSLLRLIVHIALSKLHISLTTMLLYMSEDSEEDNLLQIDWESLRGEEKRLMTSLVDAGFLSVTVG
ncbi:uncharacterized protein B0H18DRAFT_974825 [Fomitopsis serialis]|uniref:uncharacterized protein n=1 Tax=Fomitopsis serialis TaxID=139415 RepID=UPI0020087FFB|nr:uncharacterized protein B0H18DRAFT_974825 [Neoantrodia serialis]KAH9936643.1 hypothetical protein B0H18DRAFT_974825 [Neoantrodia serialis]